MIITKHKPMKELLELLQPYDKIAVIGCGGCTAYYKTGGREQVAKLAQELEAKGKEIVTKDVIARQCSIKMVSEKIPKEVGKADAVVSLSCGVGVQTLSERLKTKTVLPTLNTHFMGRQEEGIYREFCLGCGNCILYKTGGICPIAGCPKSLMNGPCGGVDEGKCELDSDKDCVWVLIYNKLQALGKIEDYKKISPPKDFSIASHPGKIEVD